MPSVLALCFAGLATLILGADLITRGGAGLAARLGLPPIVVGLTVVAIGTSTPELAVAIQASAQGDGALAIGNVAGANIINLLLVLGLSAILLPIPLRLQTIRVELPVAVFATLILVGLAVDGRLTRMEGGLLLAGAVAYTVLVVWLALGESRAAKLAFTAEFTPPVERGRDALRGAAWELALLAAGIAIILVGAEWFVNGAVGLARLWGVSEAFIGVTIVALGTTSPELATTIISVAKKQRDIGLGNLLGSCTYNVLLVVGAGALAANGGILIPPEFLGFDLPVMALAVLACAPLFMSGRRLDRFEGCVLVAGYVAFLSYLIASRT